MEARIRPTGDGDFHVELSPQERALLRALPAQLRELLESDDPSVYRLFPSAYPEHPDHENEYVVLTRDELVDSHRAALDALEATADADRLDAGQLDAWLHALNQLRLVLGTQLDVTEDMAEVDPSDRRFPELLVYGYLSELQDEVVEALADG